MKNRAVSIGIIVLMLLVLAASGAAADFSRSDWRYVKDITLPPQLSEDNLARFAPDTEVFAGAADSLFDLRIISGGNEEVPYVIEISKEERERTSFAVSLIDKGYVPGSHDIFTADLGQADVLHNQIEFRTPADDFRRLATVEASDDGTNWMQISEQTVYAFTVKERNFTSRNTSINYPESTARYLRVRIEDDGGGSLEIAGATVYYLKETPARETNWPSTILGTYQDDVERTTNVEIDLGTAGLPSYRMNVDIPETNYYRDVTVETSPDHETWTPIQRQAELYAFDTPKIVARNVSITYPETTARYLRLVIHDEDSPPLTVAGVEVWGLARHVVFAADAGQSYRLYYGNPEARRPSYDIERIFPYFATDTLPEATLGNQANNPDFAEKLPPVSERYPWLFPVVIAVAAVIVVLLLLIILRQVRKALHPPDD